MRIAPVDDTTPAGDVPIGAAVRTADGQVLIRTGLESDASAWFVDLATGAHLVHGAPVVLLPAAVVRPHG